MSEIKRNVFCLLVGIAASVLPTFAYAETLWSIMWLSNSQPCTGIMSGLRGPIISSYYKPCAIMGTNVSICPGTIEFSGPWNDNAAITVVGYAITMILSSPSSQGVMEIGSARTVPPDAADVFATTAGVGTNSRAGFFPAGIGIPHQGMPISMFMGLATERANSKPS